MEPRASPLCNDCLHANPCASKSQPTSNLHPITQAVVLRNPVQNKLIVGVAHVSTSSSHLSLSLDLPYLDYLSSTVMQCLVIMRQANTNLITLVPSHQRTAIKYRWSSWPNGHLQQLRTNHLFRHREESRKEEMTNWENNFAIWGTCCWKSVFKKERWHFLQAGAQWLLWTGK